MADLFAEIDIHLERMRERSKFVAAMNRPDWEHELWASIRRFIRNAADLRAATGFMAAMLRDRRRPPMD